MTSRGSGYTFFLVGEEGVTIIILNFCKTVIVLMIVWLFWLAITGEAILSRCSSRVTFSISASYSEGAYLANT